jgi:plastocyanin
MTTGGRPLVLALISALAISSGGPLAASVAAAAPANISVTVAPTGLSFLPNDVTIDVGDTVTVSNSDGSPIPHNIHWDDQLQGCPPVPTIDAWSCPRTFTAADTYTGHDDLQTSMTLTVHVTEPSITDTGTVSADVTVPSSAACLELSVTSISFGTLPLGAEDQPATPSVIVTNCSGLAGTLLASGTNAVSAAPGASWSLVDSAATCADTLGTDSYHLSLASAEANPVALGTTNKQVQTLAAGASTTHVAHIDTACPGSSGAGEIMGMVITFLVTE